MNWKRITDLVRLRYKLMWAKTRSRNGKIALFIIGYVLFAMLAALLALGGVATGIVAIEAGKAETVAQVVLSGLFVNAVLATILLGFGMNAVFTEPELLRYPLHERERFVARHFLGIVDPFWILVLILELGLVLGLSAWGGYSLGYATAAALLMFVCGYLLARTIGMWIEGLMSTAWGSAVVMLLVPSISIVPRFIPAVLRKYPEAGQQMLAALRFTPPFGAAAAMTHSGATSLAGLAVIVLWSAGLALLLVWLERRPAPRQQSLRGTIVGKTDIFDRVGGQFSPEIAPLVSHWLRFFVRNKRFRIFYLLSLPMAAFIAYNIGQAARGGGNLFVAALGILPLVTFLGTSRMAVNLYGYTGGAFRRFYLFPTHPAASLRAGSYASVLLGGLVLIPAAIIWIAFAPGPFNFVVAGLPVINGVTVLFLFNAASVWTTVFGPRRGDYNKGLGNDMSLLGNLLLMGSIFTCIFVPQILGRGAPASAPLEAVSGQIWWMLLAAPLAIVVYMTSLRAVSTVFPGRLERLLAVVEGQE